VSQDKKLLHNEDNHVNAVQGNYRSCSETRIHRVSQSVQFFVLQQAVIIITA
jgi:hypothetical protein